MIVEYLDRFRNKPIALVCNECSNVIAALRKADGSPVDDLNNITLDRVKKLFPDDADFITSDNYTQILVDNLTKPDVFDKIFEVVD